MIYRFVTSIGILLLIGLSLSAQTKKKPIPAAITSKVILISIDGLKTEDLNNPRLNIPNLKYLREKGVIALNVESVYPSTKLPAYASLITGMFPSDHGVTADNIFDEEKGISSDQQFSEIKSETIWQAAKRTGIKTAAINFPFTKDEELDFKSDSITDEAIKQSQLILISLDISATLEAHDLSIKRILEFLKLDEVTLIIVSPHGSAKADQEFRPNQFLAKKGFLTFDAEGKIKDWIAATHSSEGSAAIYLKDQNNEEATKSLEAIFREIQIQNHSPISRIVTKKEAAKLGADPRAAFFIEAAPGVMISEKGSAKKSKENFVSRSVAGYLPSRTEMRGTFIVAGKGVKSKSQIEYARIVDIAPTIARLLGFELKASRGHIISEIIEVQPK
jgi:predicted AlkP superfamily pyrophosphatase or phosphodiesterase